MLQVNFLLSTVNSFNLKLAMIYPKALGKAGILANSGTLDHTLPTISLNVINIKFKN